MATPLNESHYLASHLTVAPYNHIIDYLIRGAGMLRAADRRDGTIECSGHDYRQALEIAIALKLSASRGGARVQLPLAGEERERGKIYPHPNRLRGGDAVGWGRAGWGQPPGPDEPVGSDTLFTTRRA